MTNPNVLTWPNLPPFWRKTITTPTYSQYKDPVHIYLAKREFESAYTFNKASMHTKQMTVGIFVFDDVEVLDFAGPFEVFSVSDRLKQVASFLPILVSERPGLIRARGNFVVQPNFHFENCPRLDMLLIPGGGGYGADGAGYGTRLEQSNTVLRDWILSKSKDAQRVMSVCSGALILAQAGLLDGQRATTHRGAYEELRAIGRGITVVEGVKHVDTGKVVSSGGISAGIDMSLLVVSQTIGSKAAQQAADYMEYDWNASILSSEKHTD